MLLYSPIFWYLVTCSCLVSRIDEPKSDIPNGDFWGFSVLPSGYRNNQL